MSAIDECGCPQYSTSSPHAPYLPPPDHGLQPRGTWALSTTTSECTLIHVPHLPPPNHVLSDPPAPACQGPSGCEDRLAVLRWTVYCLLYLAICLTVCRTPGTRIGPSTPGVPGSGWSPGAPRCRQMPPDASWMPPEASRMLLDASWMPPDASWMPSDASWMPLDASRMPSWCLPVAFRVPPRDSQVPSSSARTRPCNNMNLFFWKKTTFLCEDDIFSAGTTSSSAREQDLRLREQDRLLRERYLLRKYNIFLCGKKISSARPNSSAARTLSFSARTKSFSA